MTIIDSVVPVGCHVMTRVLLCLSLLALFGSAAEAQSQGQIPIDPDTTLELRVGIDSIDANNSRLTYSLNNMNWLSDMTAVDVSIWTTVDDKIVRIAGKHSDFIAKGEYISEENVVIPGYIAKYFSCISYAVGDHNVEVIGFLTNENFSQQQLYFGLLSKFKASVIKIDGDGTLCRSMPSSASSHLK